MIMWRRLVTFSALYLTLVFSPAVAMEQLLIATSPSMRVGVEALGREFEKTHPDVRVGLFFDSGLDIRRTIAGMENSPIGQYFIGSGPIHLVAPGGDELITRLEWRYYVLPGTKRPYAEVPLVMVVPEALVDAPTSFEDLGRNETLRIAVGDPELTTLGQKTRQLFTTLGLWGQVEGRLDKASDTRSVLDHLLNGDADVGIVFGPDAVQESQRVRIVAVSERGTFPPIIHSMAMERYCPNRALCEEFLTFIQSAEAQTALKRLGYTSPPQIRSIKKD